MISGKTEKNDVGDPVHLPPKSSIGSSVIVEARGTELTVRPMGASEALAAAVERADGYRRHTKADATQTAYKSDWERFQAWATESGAAPLPATPAVVSAHLGWLASEGYSVATMERFLSAGGHFHREAGFDFPRSAHVVAETLKGIRRQVGVKRTKKAPLSLKALADACARLCDEAERRGYPDTCLERRAMLTVGWFCMLRSANLVTIQREHVRLVRFDGDDLVDDDEHPDALILHLLGSKTDQLKEGRDIGVHAQEDESICPVRALAAHFEARRFAPEDLIFPMSKRTVTRLIKRAVANPDHGHRSMRAIEECESCAVAAHRFASHSLRRGAATAQAKKGVPEREIMRQGGWKNERVMRGYIEHATLFENNPTKDLSKK